MTDNNYTFYARENDDDGFCCGTLFSCEITRSEVIDLWERSLFSNMFGFGQWVDFTILKDGRHMTPERSEFSAELAEIEKEAVEASDRRYKECCRQKDERQRAEKEADDKRNEEFQRQQYEMLKKKFEPSKENE